MSGVESLQGQLLIASPSLLDPNFRRTVVLVTEHNDEGAAGQRAGRGRGAGEVGRRARRPCP